MGGSAGDEKKVISDDEQAVGGAAGSSSRRKFLYSFSRPAPSFVNIGKSELLKEKRTEENDEEKVQLT